MTGKREKGEDETTHPEMLLDPVTLFRLIDARSTSSWDLERWKKGGGREREKFARVVEEM